MAAPSKTMAIVASHFVPSNLAAVHRARLWAQHLGEFGWHPIIVTTHFRHYQEKVDWDLMELVAPDLEIVRTWAAPVAPLGVIGDVGIRGFVGHYRALCDLAKARRLDFVHITIPSNYSALLGRLVYRRHGIPFGIDYIDPWTHSFPGSDVPLTKAWASARLARVLEPYAVADARLITGVARAYFEPVLERHPHLRSQAEVAAMPYGTSRADFELLSRKPRETYLFDSKDGDYHVFYAGALLPKAYDVLDRLLEAVRLLVDRGPTAARRLRLHFAGTGLARDDAGSGTLAPYVKRHALDRHVFEHAARIPYVDVLNHLSHAGANLVLGSTERHYTPSKSYQVAQAGRPVLALLHEESTAVRFLRDARAGEVVTFAEGTLPVASDIASALESLLEGRTVANASLWEHLEPFSARASARVLAEAADRVLAQSGRAAARETRHAG